MLALSRVGPGGGLAAGGGVPVPFPFPLLVVLDRRLTSLMAANVPRSLAPALGAEAGRWLEVSGCGGRGVAPLPSHAPIGTL